MGSMVEIPVETIQCLREHLTAISGILGIGDFDFGSNASERVAPESKSKITKQQRVDKFKNLIDSGERKFKSKK
ncbi:hypothetical protein G4D82_10485 [Flavobacterium sp. CYK-4]|uniref:hypothetical protein n=1 Tax=Flavobacterium lotistagni TaxID=2709660 RepID=UPI00140BE4FD|nr:hypothetical protein [Flavobacterium lotistagni]NHM07650.1 hypothetical protein [Flavobacterium lotistagni]